MTAETVEKVRDAFRPSALPKLEHCLFFEGSPGDTAQSSRGSQLHEWLAQCLAGQLDPLTLGEADTVNRVCWALAEVQQRSLTLHGIESPVEVFASDGQRLTAGTIDAWGFDADGELWCIDFKSGRTRDYAMQFCAYAVGLMQGAGANRCRVAALYLDQLEAQEFECELTGALQALETLRGQWLARTESDYRINPYCDWCAARGRCPAWMEDANLALSRLPAQASPVSSPQSGVAPEGPENPTKWVSHESIEALKASPEALGRFYGAFKHLVKLVNEEWQLNACIEGYLQAGIDVPGFAMGSRKGALSIDPEQFLLRVAGEIGSVRAAPLIKVNAEAALKTWAEFTTRPFPLEVTQGETAHFVRSSAPRTSSGSLAAPRRKKQPPAVKG